MENKLGKKFLRKTEDFICNNCGHHNIGNGYTNHCSKCLYSKHVDINPGDRSADCGGLMKPVGVEIKRDSYIIEHECVDCGHRKKNRASDEDDRDVIINISVVPISPKKRVW
jgi:hypothetical protein